jgi:hypothetical protein
LRQAEVSLELQLDTRVVVEAGDKLEVSLACSYCVRTRRTVIFIVGRPSGDCSAGSARRDAETHPPYPGRIVGRAIQRSEDGTVRITYRLEYDLDRFDDAKYGSGLRPWSGHPEWARVSFTLACPMCRKVFQGSSQNSIGRPWAHACACGYQFCVEHREMPRLRWRDSDLDRWHDVPERWGA